MHLTRVPFSTFYQSALHHEEFEDITTDVTPHVTPPSVVLFRVNFSGYILLWFTCKTTRRRSCLASQLLLETSGRLIVTS